jgi:hypothetical protein
MPHLPGIRISRSPARALRSPRRNPYGRIPSRRTAQLIVLGRPVRCTDPEIYAEPKRLLNVNQTPQLAGDCHDS